MLPFPKSRFPTCSAYRFWNRLQKPYPACKKHSFSNLFFGLLLSAFCLLRRVHLFVTHDLLSPFPFTIYGHLLACLWGCLTELLQKPFYYNWKLPAWNLMVCEKLFSLRQRFSHFIWTIEGKNFYVSVTYPQYYWKVSIALRGCLEKFFIVLGNFYCKTSHFTQKKNAPL